MSKSKKADTAEGTKVVMLDTSFLIRLLKEDDPLHARAKAYMQGFIRERYLIAVSAIAVAEYCVKGTLEELYLIEGLLEACYPFTIAHAENAGSIGATVHERKGKTGVNVEPRTVIPNDCKMFAQCQTEPSITAFVSFDSEAQKVYKLIQPQPNFEFIDARSTPAETYFGHLPF